MIRASIRPLMIALAIAALAASGGGVAQRSGSGSFEVGGVDVDVTGKSANAARMAGWRLAQRKGWQMLSRRMGGHGGTLSDSALDSIVSGIVVENEQIGPNRYIARLGVMFDRGRAASILGVAGSLTRSPPLLVIPVEWSGGVGRVFEQRTPWQAAWSRFRSGNSTVDYVRPSGTGPDSLLMNAGQINRRGRGWWRAIVDQYGASDVLIPIVHLYRQYPGGPVVASFQARFGPDNRLLTQFSLRVSNGDALPLLLDSAIKRIDAAYQSALASGRLRVDPTLAIRLPDPEIVDDTTDESLAEGDQAVISDSRSASNLSVQFDTPSAASVEATEQALRGIPGVRSAATTSLALGGISVMRVGYDGDIGTLKAALEARGWQVTLGTGALRIQRARSGPPAGSSPADNATSG